MQNKTGSKVLVVPPEKMLALAGLHASSVVGMLPSLMNSLQHFNSISLINNCNNNNVEHNNSI